MAEFHVVAKVGEIAPGEAKHVEIGDKEIGVYNLDGEYYAIGDVCTHAYAQLTDGDIYPEDGTVACPLHGAEFDIRTGKNLNFPAPTPVPTYVARVNGENIEVCLGS
ncbi:MAG: non-heme iron oxygenase ferredoxin subunit [Chloroflexota bacterium]|nr:non-heme iron oxygenase ferredoxin subunit [Chloroflexota bacterium]